MRLGRDLARVAGEMAGTVTDPGIQATEVRERCASSH